MLYQICCLSKRIRLYLVSFHLRALPLVTSAGKYERKEKKLTNLSRHKENRIQRDILQVGFELLLLSLLISRLLSV